MWKTVSDSLKGSLIKKKNLNAGAGYAVRVRYRDSIDWNSFSRPVYFRTIQVDILAVFTIRMSCPDTFKI